MRHTVNVGWRRDASGISDRMKDELPILANLLVGVGIQNGLQIHAERRQADRRWQVPPRLVSIRILDGVKSRRVLVRRKGMPVSGLRHVPVMRGKGLFRKYSMTFGVLWLLCHFWPPLENCWRINDQHAGNIKTGKLQIQPALWMIARRSQ
jgi:hypothetical protein